MKGRGIDRAVAITGVKRDPELVAASTLASLLASEKRSSSLTYQQNWHRQQQQARLKSEAKKLELPERFTKNGRRRAVPFPLKLMQVLSDEEYCHIISWMPNGRSFVILRPKAFVSDILPKHFKSAQYASFTRKLARWGFSRCEDGSGEFYHPQFHKGRLDLAEKMTCLGPSSNCKSLQAKKRIGTMEEVSLSGDVANESDSPSQSDESTVSSVKAKDIQDQDDKKVDDRISKHPEIQNQQAVGKRQMNVFSEKDHMLQMELEAMRLRSCIRAAALSRKALAELQRQSFASLFSKNAGRVDSLTTIGYPELPIPGQNPFLFPFRNTMISPSTGTRRVFAAGQGLDSLPSIHARRFPNMKGAKTA